MPGHHGASRRPATFLRQVVGARTQHENLCDEILRLAKVLSASTDAQARKYLLAERTYRSGETVNGGSFRCVGCGTVAPIVVGRHDLPRCGTCGVPPCPNCGKRTENLNSSDCSGSSTPERLRVVTPLLG